MKNKLHSTIFNQLISQKMSGTYLPLLFRPPLARYICTYVIFYLCPLAHLSCLHFYEIYLCLLAHFSWLHSYKMSRTVLNSDVLSIFNSPYSPEIFCPRLVSQFPTRFSCVPIPMFSWLQFLGNITNCIYLCDLLSLSLCCIPRPLVLFTHLLLSYIPMK